MGKVTEERLAVVRTATTIVEEELGDQGGDSPRSNPCQALSAHGFLGKEREVVEAIAAWIKG
ncbi:MAG: hypothetical protein NTY64_02795, partial [Deltaproteobacteria bacterium]|nr:hypothetical protein [Deltaproteobacteria bacterium]